MDMLYDADKDEYYCLRCSFTGKEQEVLRLNAAVPREIPGPG